MSLTFNEPNRWGALFPTELPEKMAQSLGILPGERVLDIGGGGAPLPEADVVVEYDVATGRDRDGACAPLDRRWVVADAQSLPFSDHSFDFAYSSHVLEHVLDPAVACEEMMRVAKRGYIETPRKMTELFYGHPTHRWLVDVVDGVLTFERRLFIESPLQNMALAHVVAYPGAYQRFLIESRNLTCVQFLWSGRFRYRVIDSPDWAMAFDYDNTNHAAPAHFLFALNLLANGAPPGFVASHARIAIEIMPGEGVFHLLDGVVKLLSGDTVGARAALQTARDIGCDDAALAENLNLSGLGGQPDGAHLPLGRGWVAKPDAMKDALARAHRELEEKQKQLDALSGSRSWRLTAPLRAFMNLFRKF
jgi:SAM-dependent methyltransferase